MILDLHQELLLALHANEPDDFRAWLSLGIERLEKPAVIELLLDWMDPILTTDEADKLMGWHLAALFRLHPVSHWSNIAILFSLHEASNRINDSTNKY